MNIVKVNPCKKVTTFDPKTKKSNGWLLEVVSEHDRGMRHLRGQMYLTIADPGVFKGYHMHAGADYFVTCIKGKIKQIVYKSRTQKQEIVMGDGHFQTTILPRGYPHAIKNIGKEPAYVLVYRFPAWAPDFKEQFDISKSDIEKPETWKKIRAFLKQFTASAE